MIGGDERLAREEVVDRRGKLAQKFASGLADLRQSYVLTYEPKGVGTNDGWHDVKVSLRGRNVVVKARPGYYADRSGK